MRLTIVLMAVAFATACQSTGGSSTKGKGASAKADARPRVCLLDSGAGNSHEERVTATLMKLLKEKGIEDVRVQSFPIYEEDGTLLRSRMLAQVVKAGDSCDLVHLSWNIPRNRSSHDIEQALQTLASEKAVLVGAAGSPTRGIRPLSETALGSVPAALIVGEKADAGTPKYEGPEMYATYPAPAGTWGSSFSSLVLTADLITRWSERTPAEWRAWAKAQPRGR